MIDRPLARLSPRQPWERAAAGAGLSVEIDDDGIGLVEFDQPAAGNNRFTPELLERLDAVLDELKQRCADGSLEGVVFASAKEGSFIVGVDVAAIASVADEATAIAATRRGQEIFQKVADLPATTVAAINGTCLGGATELALACDYRVVAADVAVEVGLPEVNLGIFPGFGGSQRLPRLISLERALPMILAGKAVSARRAVRIGLADVAVPPGRLREEARRRAASPPRRRRTPPEDRPWGRRLRRWLIEGQPIGRAIVFRQARKSVLERTGGHYPAPVQALDTVRRGLRTSLEKGLALEAERVGRLIVSPVCRNLLAIFLSRQEARAEARRAQGHAIDKIGVLGAGVMGGGIAQLAAYYGVRVRLKDVAKEPLTTGLAVAHDRFRQRQRAGKLGRRGVARGMGRISPTLSYTGFATTDLVIEAVVENVDVKRAVLAELEDAVGSETVVATNTSSLTLAEMATGMRRPGRLVGLHFFNPVHRMPLVEVVRAAASDDDAVGTALRFARRLGKVPVLVADSPGFLVNRVLTPYLNEALVMVEAGVDVGAIDAALERFGMPMGPLRLLDEIGLDVSDHVARRLAPLFADRLSPSQATGKLVEAGRFGKKSSIGFYRYGKGKPRPDVHPTMVVGVGSRTSLPDVEIVDRCILLMLNEACLALQEELVASPAQLDLAMVMGTGFAPFRGGILRYADAAGVGHVRDRLAELAEQHGARFEPAELLEDVVRTGGFYVES